MNRRPIVTVDVMEALEAVRKEAAAALHADPGTMPRDHRARLERGIRHLEDLRAWFLARAPLAPVVPGGRPAEPVYPNAIVRVTRVPDELPKGLIGARGRVVTVIRDTGNVRVRFRHGVDTLPRSCLVVLKR